MNDTYVTGANGFIGKHLMKRLGKKAFALRHGTAGLEYPKYFKRFFFLSTYGNMQGQDDFGMTLHANIWEPIAAITRSNGSGHFIFVSTSSVLLPVQTLYSRSKFATEQVLMHLIDQKKPVFIARPYSVTGVGEQKQHLIPTLIRSCLEGEPMKFYPEATHDFIDVSDFVDGLLLLSEQKHGGVFEFGGGVCHSNSEVKCIVERITGKQANVDIVTEGRPYDSRDWCCRNHRAMGLGWGPKKSLEQSITEMVEDYKRAH